MSTTTVLLCGVGGQGTILAADLLARAALAAGLDVKVSEIHGMAQRGGSVTTTVRFGESVESMIADSGDSDFVVSFETTEALRNLPYLKEGGKMLVSDETITPMTVLTGAQKMPEKPQETLAEQGALLIPAVQIAADAGTAKASNVALLGALSVFLGFDESIWEDVISQRVPPKTIQTNLTAFHQGRAFVCSAQNA